MIVRSCIDVKLESLIIRDLEDFLCLLLARYHASAQAVECMDRPTILVLPHKERSFVCKREVWINCAPDRCLAKLLHCGDTLQSVKDCVSPHGKGVVATIADVYYADQCIIE